MDQPPELDRTIKVKKDAREEGHIRSFTKWVNSKVSKIQPKVHISELSLDLRDGLVLISLLEVLIHNKLPREKGKLRVHHVSNVEIVFKTLEKEKIKLHGISAQAIVDGNLKSTLALVWSIILHYQVHGVLQEEPHPSQNDATEEKPQHKISEVAVEEKLLRWVQGAVEGYDDVVQVNDLSKSWRDGMAFNLLIHVHRNNLFELEDVERMSNKDRLDHAFNVADQHLHVQKLLEPSDVDQANPDKKLVMMYVSSLYQALRQYEPVKRAKRRKVVEETMMAVDTSIVESAPPEPSETFLQFKGSLVQVSTSVQKTESDYALVEKSLENRIDAKAWEEYEIHFRSVQSAVKHCREEGKKALMDNSQVSKTESDEIRSDLKALEIRWSTLESRTEFQRKRIASFRNNEEKELKELRRQRDVYRGWMDEMNGRLDKIAAMESENNVGVLKEQADKLTRIGGAINSDPVPRKVFEFGRSLVRRNVLTADQQVKVKEQVIAMENELETLKSRAREDIDRFNGNIDSVKQSQAQQMGKWRIKAESMCDWLDAMEDGLQALDSPDDTKDIKIIYKHLKECQNLQQTIKNDERPHSIVEYGETVIAEKTLSKDQKAKIEKQLKEMNNEWRSLLEKAVQINARLDAKRDESELDEKHKVEEWIRKFELLLKQMTTIKGTIVKIASIQNISEKHRNFQDCVQVVQTIQPEYQNAVKCAEEVLLNDACPDWEKSQVKDDVELLKTTWTGVLEDIDAEQESINDTEAEAANVQIEKIQKWREVYKEVDKWYQMMSAKVEGNFTMGKTLPVVREQIAAQEKLSNEMVMTHETVEFLLDDGQELLQNPNTPEPEKNKLRKDIANLVERWESLSGPVNNRLQRLSDMENHLKENLTGKLEEWTNQVTSVEGWLTREEKKFQAMGGIAPNLEAAMKQKPRAETMAKEMKQEEKKLSGVLRLGDEIVVDASLSEEDTAKLQQELSAVQNRWEALDEKINWRIKRLDETISKLGSQQEDKLEKWRENAAEISDWLDKAQLRLAERGPIGSDLKSVSSQKDEFQSFLDDSLTFQRHIYEFTEFSENLRTDPCISEEERIKVLQKTESLKERWDVIVKQINSHHNALEEQLDELEEKHRKELLDRWKGKYQPLVVWLSSTENEIKSLKDIGENALAVQKQQEEIKILISKVNSYEATFKDATSLVQTINDDPLIEDREAKAVEDQASSLTKRWDVVNDIINTRSESLRVRESFLNEQEQHLLHEWKRSVGPFNNWLSKVEEDGAIVLGGNVGVNSIKDYSVRCKTLEREVEGRKPVLEEIEKLGGKLQAESTVRDDEKIHIKEEMEILQERWGKLHVKIQDNTKWADIKLIELAKKEQETLDVWRKNVEPFNTWLKATAGKLEDLPRDWRNLETLEDEHLALQRIKEDVTRHEEALSRIVTIVDKLTDDENVSENEKNNIKAEMNRLQDEWNKTQNTVNINYLSATEALMELAQKERATLEQWKKQTDPFKEWIVEAKGRYDNIPDTDEGYDVILERKNKLQTLSREIEDKEKEFENIRQLKDGILHDDRLSIPFKDNIKNEGDSLCQKWSELHDGVFTQSDRAQEQVVSLDASQKPKLDKWQNGITVVTSQQNEIQEHLKSFETLPLDVDKAKRQSSDLKVLEQKVGVNRSRVEEISSFYAEISTDPNMAKKEKAHITNDFELIKERQSRQEQETVNHIHKLDSQIRQLQDRDSAKLEIWKASSQPLHEWLSGIEEDAKEDNVMVGSIFQTQNQLEELQKLSKEFKETEPDLFNILKMGVELSTDPEISQEIRQTVTRDVASLRGNHSNVDELLKSQRDKMKSQLLILQQHQEKCLIDWNQRKSVIDAPTKTMEKRIRNVQPIGDTFDEVQSQKDEIKKTEKELESLEWEVTTVLEYGETLCNDKAIFDKEKQVIRSEMKSIESALNNSRNNIEKRKQNLNSKLDELRAARANEFLSKWKQSSATVTKWMDICEEEIRVEVDDPSSIVAVRKRLDDIDELAEKIESFEPEFSSTIKHGEEVLKEPSVEVSDKDKVENELLKIKERWQLINNKLDSLMSRMEDQEVNLSKRHDENSKKWRENVQDTRDWCKESQTRVENLEKPEDISNYNQLVAGRKELQAVVEMLPKYEVRVTELGESCQRLSQNSKNKANGEKLLQENEALQKDFRQVKLLTESSESNYDARITNLESTHGEQLSEWNKRGERLERRLQGIESQWQDICHLENADEEEIATQRPQIEAIISDLNDLQRDYDRHISFGHQLSVNPALNSDTRTIIQQKLSDYEIRWKVLQKPRKLFSKLPRVAVVENIARKDDTRNVESEMDTFDDFFGIDSADGRSCPDLMNWRKEHNSALDWCSDAEKKVEKLRTPAEYMVLVERQHNEIEEMIQKFTSYERTISKMIDKGNHLLADADSFRISKDDRARLENDIKSIKTKWEELQEKAFDTERSLNEHVNKLQEFQDWKDKSLALTQWFEMTDRKLDCCSEPSDDLDERQKQKEFLQNFVTEKNQNEESINDVLNLGRYIVNNHLVLKNNYDEVNDDVKSFKDVWNEMLLKAEQFCKSFGVHFSHINLSLSDPFDQWKNKVKDLEKWLEEANGKLTLNESMLKEYSALIAFPQSAEEISQGIDNYCVPNLNEITCKGQDIFNSKKYNPSQNTEITDTIARLSERIKTLRLFTESQKVHVRNSTLAFFNEKLNASEAMVENVLENLKKLKSVGTHDTEVRDQVDLIKSSEVSLQRHILEFEDSKKQILEMEDKGYLSSDGFEGTLKVKSAELEPRLMAVEKQVADTKNRLAKGVINFHGQHKDEVKKWLKYCERKLSEIDCDSDDINGIYEEYCKIQELRREIMKGEQSFLNTLELNERLLAEAMLNEKQEKEYQDEIASVAKWRNDLQRRVQEKDLRLYISLVEGLNGMLTTAIYSFEEARSALSVHMLSNDFDTATEQMDGAKHVVQNIEEVDTRAQLTLELTQKISTMGILILKENDKGGIEEKMRLLIEYCGTLPGKSREDFNRLFDGYLVLFKKEFAERKNWILVNENRMSSSYMDIEHLDGFQEELNVHKAFAHELKKRDMKKMSDVADRVTELDKNVKMEVRNLDKRWKVLMQWSDDYFLDLQRVVMEWRSIHQKEKALIGWLDPHEKQLSEINEKINLVDHDGMKQQLINLKTLQSELEDQGLILSNIHIKGMALMKFLNTEATASCTIHKDLADLDRRWNSMAKDILERIELLRNIEFKQQSIQEQKDMVNTYIDETNSELDDHETKNQQLRGDIPHDAITENGESSREKKVRVKKEKETLQQDVVRLTKSLEERIANFPKYQSGVDNINGLSKDLEDVADNDSKVVLHDELVRFSARWQVIVTRLDDYSDNDLPEHMSWGCMGFVKRRLGSTSY